ncbi:hypothetical protein BX600DRAFT_467307 [Xylariales sp. PMI_506]|nr:hypothetical protein BX600DRAFT_467307 [Xylariales sp. PMI_506]
MVGFRAAWIGFAIIASGLFQHVAALQSLPSPLPTAPLYSCAQAASPQLPLEINTTVVEVGPRPWGLIYLNETIAFAAINFSIGVLDTSEFTPKLTNIYPLSPEYYIGNDDIDLNGYGFRELTLSHDLRNLFVTTGYGAIIYDVPGLLAGENAVVGVLSSNGYCGRGAIELNITPNDEFVFISQEFGSNNTYDLGNIEVYNISRLDNGTVLSTWRGFIVLGHRTIGQQFNKNYTSLFVTSEISTTATSLNQTTGYVSILDVETLKYTPGKAFVGRVSSGCHPVRCSMSADKNHLWVTTREGNQVLAFDAELLSANETENALSATVNTGTSPIGIAAFSNHILTADSNRFNYTNATAGVTVVNAENALARAAVSFPQISTGAFPRSFAISPDGNTALVSEFGTGYVRAMNISQLLLL